MKERRFVRELLESKQRILVLSFVVGVVFLFLVIRLWHLQILQTENYQAMSENNRLRFVPVAASRGTIMDRTGKILVNNRPSFSLAIIPQEVKDKEALLTLLSELLGLDRADMAGRWEKSMGRAKYYPIVLASNLTRDHVEIVEENRLRLPGVEIEMKPVREYSGGELAAHLLGYIGEVSEKELDSEDFEAYNPGDYIGKNGIERALEGDLHGNDGGRQLEVDARGRVLRTVSESYPTVGSSVMLTIDASLQKQAELAFGDQAGAAVVIDVNSGEILAFVSNPGFDPSLFSGRLPADIWQGYLNDVRHPLENKALSGQYPPGSTFKMITALAGLQNNLINDSTTVNCNGSHKLGTSTFKCWNKKGHGVTNLRKSLRESCDVFYYELGEKLGVDKIAAAAQAFKLGTPLGVELLNERSGLIPTAEWKQKRFGKRWYRGETLPVAIGQGAVLLTPIQLASMTATIANEGTIYRPHLVKRIVDADGRTLRETKTEIIGTASFSKESFRLVKQGMLAVVNEPGGTGSMARLYDVKVAGKTGTSQVVKLRDSKQGIPYQYRDHALFVAFAPFDNPEIAVAVVIEHGEHGGAAAAPIAGRILRTYFDGKKPPRKEPSETAKEESGDEDTVTVTDEKEMPAVVKEVRPPGDAVHD
ncbi:MAG: penicillin-binding protein 2 [Desulfuromonadaceae bacterium]|nr:penicillin-binding protein 2 [Desulfuromonadaceae bacterium]MDD2848824.1 penicillin-binding protein 2 [Desulfuromonadaceae bacterium]MDD4130474.1 penicillin-binding protein 2 [Desulfuromonadaceae bacterium]